MPRNLLMVGLLIAGLPFASAHADDVSGRYGLGFEAGLMKLVGGESDFSNAHWNTTFHLFRGLSPRWTLDLAWKYGWVRPGARPGQDAGLTLEAKENFYTVISQPEIGFLFRTAPDRTFAPFFGLGLGATVWSVQDHRRQGSGGLVPDGPTPLVQQSDGQWTHLHDTNITASVTAGVEWFTSPSVALTFGGRYHHLFGSDLDNVGIHALLDDPTLADANSGLVEGFLGLNLYFGATDNDGDGIKNSEDACPDSPEDFDGYEDADGCPDRDNDGDGILDTQDDCPDSPEDRDGFQDSDGCPDPDNDGDGIPDTSDDCPDVPEDLDGFKDQDGCPDPDNDGDGVLDAADRCPGTPPGVKVDSSGCPEVKEIKAQLTLTGVTFLSGSAQLTPASLAVLREVAASLAAYPDVRIEVRGHTDSAGSAESNRDLSHRRAIAVRDTIIQLGISPSRITAVGYGEDYPVASNETPEGRATNRRVEIHRVDR